MSVTEFDIMPHDLAVAMITVERSGGRPESWSVRCGRCRVMVKPSSVSELMTYADRVIAYAPSRDGAIKTGRRHARGHELAAESFAARRRALYGRQREIEKVLD